MWSLFVSCAPGLEALLATELAGLGFEAPKREPGGVSVTGDARSVMTINLHCALGSHVLLRVGSFEARHFSALVKQAARLPWASLIPASTGWTVRATCRRSKLYHSDAVAQRVDAAIGQALGRDSTEPSVEVVVRFDRDRCVISIDTSGAPLHRRGWRLQTGKAPLREDLARALVVASGWDGTAPLIDPFAGSGTLVIEAACLARKLAPGRLRSFAFERLQLMDASLWSTVRAAADAEQRGGTGNIEGRDRVRGALTAAAGNAERAGVADDITLTHADLQDEALPTADGLTVITNPPYGHRVKGGAAALAALQRRVGEAHAATVAIVAPVDAPVRLASVALTKQLMTDHGGTKVAFFVGSG